MTAESFLTDIPLDLAQQAHRGTSFTPEKRGDQEREGYAQTLAADYANLLKYTEGKPGMLDVLNSEFARYREGYRTRTLKHLHSQSRCFSSMISGPSNYPVRQQEKRRNVEHKRLEELIEFRERALAAIKKTLCPELRPIMAGDSDAVPRLQKEIEEAEKLQARMIQGNKIVRKFLREPHNGRLALEQVGFTAGQAQRMFEPDFCGRLGFASFELTNNGANIRRMKKRLETVSRNQSTPATEAQGENARFEDCPADNRVRLFFPGKPSGEVRGRLKSCGFRWSPTIGAWQAYRNSQTILTARQEAGL